jgi:predicted cupin superfamily sugar epimerase
MTVMHTARYWKEKLELASHIEGGAFRETYRSALNIQKDNLTPQHGGSRAASTSIYFLLEDGEFSAFHRIASDELWHFYDGDTLAIYEINTRGELIKHLLGRDIEKGESLQVLIPAGSWFGSKVENKGSFALCGCTVSPGFDFADFELVDGGKLREQYPQHADIIGQLTR